MSEILAALTADGGAALLLSLPPGVFWLWYVYHLDRYRPEPLWLIALVVLLGAISPLVVHLMSPLQDALVSSLDPGSGVLQQAAFFIVGVGMIEEGCKMLVTWPVVWWVRRVDEVVDAVVLSGAAALGFATIENVLYVTHHGAAVLPGRAILSTFGHVLMSSVWGFALGYAKTIRGPGRVGIILMGWLGAATVHGLYDVLVKQNLFPLAILLLFVLWRWFLYKLQETYPNSPHRPRVARRVTECPHCQALARRGANFCSSCGRPIEAAAREAFCSSCLKTVASDNPLCSCGSTLL